MQAAGPVRPVYQASLVQTLQLMVVKQAHLEQQRSGILHHLQVRHSCRGAMDADG